MLSCSADVRAAQFAAPAGAAQPISVVKFVSMASAWIAASAL